MFDAIVLAGGGARRLGGADKPAVVINGTTLLERAIAAAADAERVVVVGPRRASSAVVLWTREDPPGGGPVAAIAAGLDCLDTLAPPDLRAPVELQAPVELRAAGDPGRAQCLVLAADLPAIAPAVAQLRAALEQHVRSDVAVLTAAGRRNTLAALWHTDALRAALPARQHLEGAAVRELFTGRAVVEVTDPAGWGADCDTWLEVEQARTREGQCRS